MTSMLDDNSYRDLTPLQCVFTYTVLYTWPIQALLALTDCAFTSGKWNGCHKCCGFVCALAAFASGIAVHCSSSPLYKYLATNGVPRENFAIVLLAISVLSLMCCAGLQRLWLTVNPPTKKPYRRPMYTGGRQMEESHGGNIQHEAGAGNRRAAEITNESRVTRHPNFCDPSFIHEKAGALPRFLDLPSRRKKE